MTQNLFRMGRFMVFAIIGAGAAGCATAPLPWMENGETLGTIRKNKATYGFECRYVDHAGRLCRIEKRDPNDSVLPGAAVTRFRYDAEGRPAEEQYFDREGTPARCEEGFVVKKYTYSVNAAGDQVVGQIFLDRNSRPVRTSNGYAIVRLVYEGLSKNIKEITLGDEHRLPASGMWDEIPGVTCVKFAVLEGMGAVRVGVYYGPTGKVVGRKQIAGTCYVRHTTTTYY